MKGHRLAQAPYGPAKLAKSMTQLRLFAANEIAAKPSGLAKGRDAHQCIATTGQRAADGHLPFQIDQAVIN